MSSFAKALSQTKTAKPKASAKKQMAKIPASEEVKHEVDNYQQAKARKKKAEAEMEASGTIILEFAGKHQDQDGFNGDFKNAYQIDGFDESVKYVSSNRFSINPADVDQLHDMLEDGFDELLEEKYDVSLKEEVFKDQQLQNELMALVGDRFGDFFETKASVKVKDDFDKNIFKHVTKKTLPILRTFCRPYKASLR